MNFFNDKSYHKVLQHTIIETDIDTVAHFPTTYKPDLKTIKKGQKDPFLKKVKDRLKDVWLRMIKSPQADRLMRKVILNNERAYKSLGDVLEDTLEEGTNYTYMIRDGKFVYSGAAGSLVDELASKHIFLSNGQQVQFAGEFTFSNKTFTIDSNSGTYKPSDKEYSYLKSFMEKMLDGTDYKVEVRYITHP